MNYNSDLQQLENKLTTLKEELSSTKGKISLLSEQITTSEHKIEELNNNKEIFRKSVELLILVQSATKDKIKLGFEQIVTYAIRYIFNDDYKFNLEFGRRGNLSDLDFTVSTPNCKKPFNPLDSDSGGVLNILSLALRVSLLELAKPKIQGFLILDEPFHHINGAQQLQNGINFIKEINKKINRQIIIATNKSEFENMADNVITLYK